MINTNVSYLKWGIWVYALTVLAIGLVHFVAGNFPQGLVPVAATVPGRQILVYVTGLALILSGAGILIPKFSVYGAWLAAITWLLLFVLVHTPKLVADIHNGSEWAGAFEVVALIGGALIIAGITSAHNYKWVQVGKYLFLSALIVFTVEHYIYLQYIVVLIPAWLPAKTVLAWVVFAGFFAASVSILINVQVKLAALLLALMFFIWFLILHIPRVIAKSHEEPEWTSLFVVAAAGGISLLIAGLAANKNSRIEI